MAKIPAFLKAIRAEATRIAPGRSQRSDGIVGDKAHAARKSDHNPDARGIVHAVDVTHDPAGGFDSYKYAEIVRQKCADGRETRVKYIVSYSPTLGTDIIASAPEWEWRPKTTRAHYNHVHISIHSGAQVENSTAPLFNTPIPEPTPVVLPDPPSTLKGRPRMLEQPPRPNEGPRDPTRPQVARIEPAAHDLIWLHNGCSVAGDASFGPGLRYLQIPTTPDNPIIDLIVEDGPYTVAGFTVVTAKGHGHPRVWS